MAPTVRRRFQVSEAVVPDQPRELPVPKTSQPSRRQIGKRPGTTPTDRQLQLFKPGLAEDLQHPRIAPAELKLEATTPSTLLPANPT